MPQDQYQESLRDGKIGCVGQRITEAPEASSPEAKTLHDGPLKRLISLSSSSIGLENT